MNNLYNLYRYGVVAVITAVILGSAAHAGNNTYFRTNILGHYSSGGPEPAPAIRSEPPLVPRYRRQSLATKAFFDSGRATLKKPGKAALDELLTHTQGLQPQRGMGSYGFVAGIEALGHTDSLGSARANEQLGLRRADAVRDYLISRGVTPDAISAQSAGETQAIADNRSRAGRAQNRRSETTLHLVLLP